MLIYVANAALLFELFRFRAARIADDNIPYFSGSFIALMAVAIVLAAFSIGVVRTGYFQVTLNRVSRRLQFVLVIGVICVGHVLLGAVATALPALKTYLAPFVVWQLLIDLALLSGLVLANRGNEFAAWRTTLRSIGGLNKRVTQAGVLLALSILVPLIILEIGLRIWFTNWGTEEERVSYVYSWDEITRTSWRVRGVPYINYGLSPTFPGHNSLGYRGEEIQIPKPEGVFRIVAVGGSTTYGSLIENDQETYPAQLQSILRETHGYTNVEVVNAGVPSYTTWEILVNFEFRVLDLEPDIVIFYEAVNDLGPRAVPPEYYAGLRPTAGIWTDADPGLSPSVLQRYLAINLHLIRDPRDLEARTVPQYPELKCCENVPHEELARRIQANRPIYFERNLQSLIAIAKANEVRVMLSTWAYFPDPVNDTGLNLMTLDYRQEAIAEHNAITTGLAAEMSTGFYDLAANFPYDADLWYWDGVHMTPMGTHEQASQYAAFLVENGLIADPI